MKNPFRYIVLNGFCDKVINRLVLTLLGFRQFCHAYTPVGSVEVFVKPNYLLDRTVEGGEAKKRQFRQSSVMKIG